MSYDLKFIPGNPIVSIFQKKNIQIIVNFPFVLMIAKMEK